MYFVHETMHILWWLVNKTDAARQPVEMSQQSLADDMGISRATVHRALKRLRKGGWVEWVSPRHPNGQRRSTAQVYLANEVGGIRIVDWLNAYDAQFSKPAKRDQKRKEEQRKKNG
jgi:DNA-binding transcriptional MocR family regulator